MFYSFIHSVYLTTTDWDICIRLKDDFRYPDDLCIHSDIDSLKVLDRFSYAFISDFKTIILR